VKECYVITGHFLLYTNTVRSQTLQQLIILNTNTKNAQYSKATSHSAIWAQDKKYSAEKVHLKLQCLLCL